MKKLVLAVSVLMSMCSLSQGATWYVDVVNGVDTADGQSWATARKSIQSAVDVSDSNDVIVVAAGSYQPISTGNKAITIQSQDGASTTVIDGEGIDRCATMGSQFDQTNTVLTGFTLRNGNAEMGGGSICGTLANCTLTNNTATFDGAGSYGGILDNCTLVGNTAARKGGGAYAGVLRDCEVAGNAAQSGGGVAEATLDNCTLQGNTARDGGGAAASLLNHCTLRANVAENWGGGSIGGTLNNCLLVGNAADANGGGSAYGVLDNCTLSANVAGGAGGGSCHGMLNNSIVWGNVAPTNANVSGASLLYSLSSPLQDGEGNISGDPLFFDEDGGEYDVCHGSLCVDSGTNALAVGLVDLQGNARIMGACVDMGAFEYVTNTYRVLFDAQGGEEPSSTRLRVVDGSVYGTLPTTSRTGYTFDGWWTGTNGVEICSSNVVSTTSNLVLLARWVANTYTVSFDADGGTVDPATKTVAYGQSYGTLPEPVRQDFIFDGWWTDADGGGTQVDEGTVVSEPSDHTVVAKWIMMLNSAVDQSGETWETGGAAEWVAQTNVTHDGIDAAQSGTIGDGQQSWMQTSVTGPGNLSFWWKASSQTNSDSLRFSVNSVDQSTLSGNAGWQQKSYLIAAGDYVLKWSYSKDASGTSGVDGAWVDQVTWTNEVGQLLYPVYRFWRPALNAHFFTISESEKNNIIANLSNYWTYEGIGYYAYASSAVGAVPVYRFWNPTDQRHYFTISESEKNTLCSQSNWSYEGIRFYAHASAVVGSMPVYKFKSPVTKQYFYTISEIEKNNIIANLSSYWTYLGIAFYAFPTDDP